MTALAAILGAVGLGGGLGAIAAIAATRRAPDELGPFLLLVPAAAMYVVGGVLYLVATVAPDLP